MDKLEFLDGAEAPNEDVRPNAEPPAEPQASEAEPQGRARDDKGRFAAKIEAPAPVEAPAAPAEPTPAAPQAEQPMVPLAALHETRDKVRDLEARLATLTTPQQPQAPQAPPDMFEDPDGYRNWQQSQIVNVQLNISEEMTREKYGNEMVDAARDWAMQQFQTNPSFAQEVLSQRNPYGYAVQAYQKHQSLQSIGSDPEDIKAYLAWKQAQSAQPQPPAAQPPPVAPTQSLASAPSAGGTQHTAEGPGVAFDNAIR